MIESKNIYFKYKDGPDFRFPDIRLSSSEDLLISGPSGIGKTTLLHILGLLLSVEEGSVIINNTDTAAMKEKEKDLFRGKHIGIVFQKPSFIQSLSVLENIEAKLFFSKSSVSGTRIDEILERLEMLHLKNKNVLHLSEGQKQRLSIAVAMINKPSVILADEPTSHLDDSNSEKVISLLKEAAAAENANLVLITHDKRINAMFDKILTL
jgi:putative ABC transport system ATP-binding protein